MAKRLSPVDMGLPVLFASPARECSTNSPQALSTFIIRLWWYFQRHIEMPAYHESLLARGLVAQLVSAGSL
jgi:hypothetical protein